MKNLAAAGAAISCCFGLALAETGKCDGAARMSDAKAVRQFLSDFLLKEETELNHDTLVKLMEQRGRACCCALEFRQKMIQDSQGNLDKLVEVVRLFEAVVGRPIRVEVAESPRRGGTHCRFLIRLG